MAWRAARSLNEYFSRERHTEEKEADEDHVIRRSLFAITNGYANYHVRLKDVKAYVAQRELRRRRRLGFQLETIFLFFFIPLCVYWNAALGNLEYTAQTLGTKLFPISPIPPDQFVRESSYTSFLDGIASEDEFWQWINNVLYQEVFVQGQCGLAVSGNPDAITVGLVRIRQVQVSPTTCPLAASLMEVTCYPPFSSYDDESTNPIGNFFEYQTSAATTEMDYEGDLAQYPGSGFVINLTTGVPPGQICNVMNLTQMYQLLQARQTPFFDVSTRAIIVTITSFSPNSGALVTTRFGVEYSYSGVFQTTIKNDGVIFYRSASDLLTMQVLTIFVAIIECVFMLSVFWGIIFAWRIDSFTWMSADLASCGLMIYQLYILLGFFFDTNYVADLNDSINQDSEGAWAGSGFYSGSDLDQLTDLSAVNGAILFLTAFRMFRFSQYFSFMTTIHGAFERTYIDILLYFILLCLLSLGYVLCGIVVVGYNVEVYRSYPNAIFAVMKYFVLNMDYYTIARVEPLGLYFAPLFLASFLLIFTWYMFAVFVAIMYMGYRVQRTTTVIQEKDRQKWTKEAEKVGALCPIEEQALPTLETDDANNSSATSNNKFGGILLRKTFYYYSWRQTVIEYLRQFIGLPERSGFIDYATILMYLGDYEENLNKNVLSASKRFYVSFGELMDIVSGRSLDLVEELRRTQNDVAAAEEYRRLRLNKVTDVDRSLYQERNDRDGDPDAYLLRMDPVEIQLTRIFRHLWIIPEDKVETLARNEADDSGGQIKRSLLVRIQSSLRILDDRENEANRGLINKIQTMRVVQQTMERDLKAMRELLK